jgi:cytochrome c oxidase cbb3-type subunit III
MCLRCRELRRAAAAVMIGAFSLALLALGGCKEQERELRLDPAASAALEELQLAPQGHGGALPRFLTRDNPYQTNAYQLNEGKRLYEWFNCDGCHAQGGGGAGPALFDGEWLYGGDLVDLVATIRDGRPNGMPAFRDKLPSEQLWQLAGYVQAMADNMASGGAPSRNDRLHARPAENRAPASFSVSRRPLAPARD